MKEAHLDQLILAFLGRWSTLVFLKYAFIHPNNLPLDFPALSIIGVRSFYVSTKLAIPYR